MDNMTIEDKMKILLCSMIYMPMVRPTMESEVLKLDQEFQHEYKNESTTFYISFINEEDKSRFVTKIITDTWDDLWTEENEIFIQRLEGLLEFDLLKDHMFFICDSNHFFRA